MQPLLQLAASSHCWPNGHVPDWHTPDCAVTVPHAVLGVADIDGMITGDSIAAIRSAIYAYLRICTPLEDLADHGSDSALEAIRVYAESCFEGFYDYTRRVSMIACEYGSFKRVDVFIIALD